MTEHAPKLKEKAIAAYEASPLKKADVEKNKKAISIIKQLISKFGIDIEVDSNPIEIDGIRFYSSPLEDSDGIYGHRVMASRKCSQCGERIVMEVADYDLDKYRPAMFEQWLSRPHLCEFADDTQVRGKVGFVKN